MSETERTADGPASSSPRSAASAWPAGVRWIVLSLAWLVGIAVAGILSALLLGSIALSVAFPNLPDVSGLTDYRPKLPLRVYTADGVLIGEFGEERRNFVPIGEIPKVMRNAILAVEDSRFYEHGGVDYLGVLRAGLANVGESRSQGASTITMQVARNFYLSTEKTFTRKIYEILLALKIENTLTKDQILEVYMNQIFLGQRAYGFAAASETYFGKPLANLTIAEAAMLAGLPKAPSAYNPIANPKRAMLRQQYIIDRMLENRFITREEHDEAREQTLRYRAQSVTPSHAAHVAEAARSLVFAQYGEEAYTRGLNVYLTIDSREQLAAYRALRKGIMDYERRQVYRGPEAYVDLPTDPAALDVRIAEALLEHPDNDELRSGVVLQADPKQVVAVLQNGESVTVSGAGLKPVESGLSPKGNPKTQIRRGAVVRLLQDAKGDWSLTQQPEVEGALVSLDPDTGAVRAMVGGFDFAKSKFNHVTQAWRQPGSSFKPFVYSAALEKGFTPATVINDAPLFFDAGVTGSQPWEPKNYDGTFEGPMSMRRALAKSKNMVSIRILDAVGPVYAQEWVTRFGFEAARHPAYLTLALGAGSVTPLQLASGYAVFANGGHRTSPVLITRLTDSRGRVLQEVKPSAPDESMRVVEARNAFVMTSLLQEVTRTGTAAKASSVLKRSDLYGKTGTTNDSLDAWFAGFQRSVVAVVWIGYDQPRKLGNRETGGVLALPVWIDYMNTALKDVKVSQPPVPEGVINIGGEWYYEEFAHGAGVASLGLEDHLPPEVTTDDERRSISTCSSAEAAGERQRRAAGSEPPLLYRMAGHLRAGRAQQGRPLALAARVGMRAAGVEGAATGRIQRIGHLAAHRRAGATGHADVRDRVEQHPGVRMAWCGEQPDLVRNLDQPAQVHHADPVADVAHHGEVVGDEEVGQAAAALQVLHDVEHLGLDGDVERRGRLVADEELRLGRQRAGDRDALALAARELVREAPAVRGRQAHGGEQFGHPGLQRRGPLHQRVLAQRLADDVQHRPARVEAGVRVLEDHLHAPAQLPAGCAAQRRRHVLARIAHAAPAGRVQAHQQPRDRALATTRFAHQRQGAAARDREADAIDRVYRLAWPALEDPLEPRRGHVEHLGQVFDLDQRRLGRLLRQARAVHAGPAAAGARSQQAACVGPAAISSGRSRRQRSKARSQRGWKAQPSGIAFSRGIAPSICSSRSRSSSIAGIEPISPAV